MADAPRRLASPVHPALASPFLLPAPPPPSTPTVDGNPAGDATHPTRSPPSVPSGAPPLRKRRRRWPTSSASPPTPPPFPPPPPSRAAGSPLPVLSSSVLLYMGSSRPAPQPVDAASSLFLLLGHHLHRPPSPTVLCCLPAPSTPILPDLRLGFAPPPLAATMLNALPPQHPPLHLFSHPQIYVFCCNTGCYLNIQEWVPQDGQDQGLQQAVQAAGRSHCLIKELYCIHQDEKKISAEVNKQLNDMKQFMILMHVTWGCEMDVF